MSLIPNNAKNLYKYLYPNLSIKEIEDEIISFNESQCRKERDFADGKGESMKTLTIRVDLSKAKWPWQSHCDQADDLASSVSDMILSEYFDYASNVDYE